MTQPKQIDVPKFQLLKQIGTKLRNENRFFVTCEHNEANLCKGEYNFKCENLKKATKFIHRQGWRFMTVEYPEAAREGYACPECVLLFTNILKGGTDTLTDIKLIDTIGGL